MGREGEAWVRGEGEAYLGGVGLEVMFAEWMHSRQRNEQVTSKLHCLGHQAVWKANMTCKRHTTMEIFAGRTDRTT